MTCKKTLHSVVVRSGDSLMLNCTCFDKVNSHWTGPNKHLPTVPSPYIPYSHGTELNPRLNKSKYMVLGGYDVHKCNLKITNVLPDDGGSYMCQYISSDTIYIDEYNVVATDLPESPKNLSAVFNSTTIVVYWQPGFDGGHPQRFYIEYRPETRSEWEVVGPLSQSNFTIDQELKYTLNHVLFAKKYYIRMYADNVVGQSNYTHLFCVEVEAINCSYNSEKYNYLDWQIISILLGGILTLSMCLNIHCLLTRKINSEYPQESQYYDIQPINDITINSASIQGMRNYLQETETNVYRLSSEGIESIASSFQKATSSESSVRSLSNLLLNENEYENPYQTIDHENIEMNPYSIITSDRYQNTTIFQKDIRTHTIEHPIQNDKEKDPWLIIYKNVKYIDKNHESIYEVLDTENQEFKDIS
ncbi:Hypothetical predicted protein [Mytilus galloprovincialis]|uniref:Fibronectin type-III domain-containing protein n=1 Tax=Mytilus galloprovincialis TaxID=29158 RepID=A0A8B6DI61_MYTGA|nr:Hypothetical predicted protein [Mytilus galloprovincialis]